MSDEVDIVVTGFDVDARQAEAGLVRLFRVRPWVRPFVGLIAGPVPLALLPRGDAPQSDRQGYLLLTAILGLLIGLVEAARIERERRSVPDDGP